MPITSTRLNPYGLNMLSAVVNVTSGVPVSYRYTVAGKTPEASFTYGVDTFSTQIAIPVIALYANHENQISITLTTQTGEEEILNTTIDTRSQEYGTTLLNLDYTVYDRAMFEATLGNGWFITADRDGYDRNGDLRMTGGYTDNMDFLKVTSDSLFYVPNLGSATTTIATTLRRVGIMGDTRREYAIPNGYAVHHDLTFDENGRVYALGTTLSQPLVSQRLRTGLFCFSDATGEVLWYRDYTDLFDGTQVLQNTQYEDVHFNSLEYIARLNLLVINSRSCSCVLIADADTGDVLYSIDDATYSPIDAGQRLDIVNPGAFVFGCGEHTVLETTNPAYCAYTTGNRFALTIFNNNSCKDANGANLERPIDDPQGSYQETNYDAQGLVYGIDLDAGTVEMLHSIPFTGHVCEYMSGIFEIGDYYSVALATKGAVSGAWGAPALLIYDAQDNIGVQCLNTSTSATSLYRGRILTIERIQALI